MTDWKLPRTGACRCGCVAIRVDAPPLLTMACHCKGCQRMTAGAFSLSAAIPTAGFSITAGEPVIGGLHGSPRHYGCTHCLSWIFTRLDEVDWFVNVRPTLLDDPGPLAVPFIESWTSEKLLWATTPAAHSFEGFPPFEAYEGLTRAFAERAA